MIYDNFAKVIQPYTITKGSLLCLQYLIADAYFHLSYLEFLLAFCRYGHKTVFFGFNQWKQMIQFTLYKFSPLYLTPESEVVLDTRPMSRFIPLLVCRNLT